METFRVSSHLKDIIGRDLVVDEFVAIFELVKNSIDAGATHIQVGFAPDSGTIEIVDDGKGMSRTSIVERWLHVAFSAKRRGTEDADGDQGYRDRIRSNRRYAGSKGIGRFSCDTLGEEVEEQGHPPLVHSDAPAEGRDAPARERRAEEVGEVAHHLRVTLGHRGDHAGSSSGRRGRRQEEIGWGKLRRRRMPRRLAGRAGFHGSGPPRAGDT